MHIAVLSRFKFDKEFITFDIFLTFKRAVTGSSLPLSNFFQTNKKNLKSFFNQTKQKQNKTKQKQKFKPESSSFSILGTAKSW